MDFTSPWASESASQPTLIPSASLASHLRAWGSNNGVASSSSSSKPYMTHLLSLPSSSSGTSSHLVSVSDDLTIRLLDVSRPDLPVLGSFTAKASGAVTALKPLASATAGLATSAGAPVDPARAWATAGRNGVVGIWDARAQGAEALTFRGPSNAPYLSLAMCEDGTSFAAGTELHGSDAEIDVWDLRQATAPLFQYTESHSDDVVSLSFHPGSSSSSSSHRILLSASTDGLVSVLDTTVDDEDDAVLGVGNLEASIARAGWLDGARGAGKTAAAEASKAGDDAMMDEDEADAPKEGPDGFWAVSDMQTVGLWNSQFDQLLEPVDVRGPSSAKPRWVSDYVVDAFGNGLAASGSGQAGLLLFTGDQQGGIGALRIPVRTQVASSSAGRSEWELLRLFRGFGTPEGATSIQAPGFDPMGHDDIVRCLEIDGTHGRLYTGGEDGRVCVWDLNSVDAQGMDAVGQLHLLAANPEAEAAQQQLAPAGASQAAGKGKRHTPY